MHFNIQRGKNNDSYDNKIKGGERNPKGSCDPNPKRKMLAVLYGCFILWFIEANAGKEINISASYMMNSSKCIC